MPDSPPRLYLASASPRRAELLRRAGLMFETRPSGVDEEAIEAGSHRSFVTKAALAKALDVAKRVEPDAVVIGADTIVCVDDDRLGKPSGRAEAEHMLRRLEKRRHDVLTGLAIVRAGGESQVDCVSTAVWFGAIPEEDLQAYLDTDEPYDKAGGYAIQAWAGRHIEKIEGDHDNVVGLPMARLLEMLSPFLHG